MDSANTNGMYIALYRKWRPQTFADMVGQDHVSQTLAKAIETDKISHAYLFAGPRGTGKTSAAKIFAKALNCENGPTPSPCGKCASCRHITDGSSMDVFEIDAASNRGIDEIRDLRETVKFAPAEGRYKVYIIDEVHMLTVEAFNALLKTLEEPPPHIVFIMATTEAHKIPVTIKSRAQRYDFKRITVDQISARLRFVADHNEPPVPVDDAALDELARLADGGMRDALSLMDQAWSLEGNGDIITAETVRNILGIAGREQIYEIAAAIADRDAKKALACIAKLLADGKDLKQLFTNIVEHLRNLMLFKAVGNAEDFDWGGTPENILREQAAKFSHDGIMSRIARLNDAAKEISRSAMPRVTAEVSLIAVCENDAAALSPNLTNSTVNNAEQNNETLARLEAKVAALAAQIESLSGKDTATFAPKPTVAAATIIKTASPVTKRTHQEPIQITPNKLEPVAEPIAEQPMAPSVAEKVADANIGQVWTGLLEALKRKNKRAVLACMQQGRLVSINANQFVVEFKSDTFVAMSEKYRALLETSVAEITGGSPHFMATATGKTAAGAAPLKAAPPKNARPRPVAPTLPTKPAPPLPLNDDTEMDETARQNLQKAIGILGGNVVEVT